MKRWNLYRKNNRGASLLIVLAIFVLLTVVAANMLMLVNAGNVKTNEELETEQTNLLISSVFETLDGMMQRGIWNDAFVSDDEATVNVTGFQTVEGDAVDVVITINMSRNQADVDYRITLPDGSSYSVPVRYTCSVTGTPARVTGLTLKECSEMTRITP